MYLLYHGYTKSQTFPRWYMALVLQSFLDHTTDIPYCQHKHEADQE